jgi:hypothetical protein
MNHREWKDAEHSVYYLFQKEDGLIVGQINVIAHTKIWVAKIPGLMLNEEKYLGTYISHDFAKAAVERYWEISERTLLE